MGSTTISIESREGDKEEEKGGRREAEGSREGRTEGRGREGKER